MVVVAVAVLVHLRPLGFQKCKMSLKGVRKTGEKIKLMISSLKEQAGETEDPDLQVKFLALTNVF